MKVFRYLVTIVLLFNCTYQKTTNNKVAGAVFGTTYSVVYNSSKELRLQSEFDSIFQIINNSLSTYQSTSLISKLNRNENVELDEHFIKVFEASKKINKVTKGVFDPTIGIMVNAWDFGPEGKLEKLDTLKINELIQSVGFDNLIIIENELKKTNANTFIDFNAIAKGYAVDVIARFLEGKKIENYLVEIGGEIRGKGINLDKNSPWKIGVERPNFDGTQSIFKVISLKNASMATSGTYRKYKVDEMGNRYSHIIDPKTGYPSKTNLLSVSVIAEDCMIADAYATAFKVMGKEKVEQFLRNYSELKVFLIFENENNDLETLSLNGFPDD